MTATESNVTPLRKRIIMVCPICGSDHIGADAWAEWSVEKQAYELGTVYDQESCLDCSAEIHADRIDLEKLPKEGEHEWLAMARLALNTPADERGPVFRYLAYWAVENDLLDDLTQG